MIHRFNYTRRQRIHQQMVSIVLHERDDGGPPSFDADLTLDALQLPPDARLTIEANRDRRAMRFDWGTVEQPQPPADRRLYEVPENPKFRVMALEPDGSGRLLALGRNLTARRAGAQSSLLWLKFADLGMEVWRLKFDADGGHPVLEVNSGIDGISREVRGGDAFRSLVLPEVMRAVLQRALFIDKAKPDDDDSAWSNWLAFIQSFFHDDFPEPNEDPLEHKSQVDEWIDNAVAAFTEKKFHARRLYQGALH